MRKSNLPSSLTVPAVDSIKSMSDVRLFLSRLTSELKKNHILTKNDIMAQLKEGVSGYFDDGANFRITVVDGIITNIADSSGAGHS